MINLPNIPLWGPSQQPVNPSYLNQPVQAVSFDIASGATSATFTINPVGALAFLSRASFFTVDGGIATAAASLTLTDNHTITATRQTSFTDAITCFVSVIDATAALVKSVQFLSVTIPATSALTATGAISTVNTASTAIICLGGTTTGVSGIATNLAPVAGTQLTDANTVTVKRCFTSGSTTANVALSLCVVEFQPAVINSLQQLTGLSNGDNPITAVVMANTMLLDAGVRSNSRSANTACPTKILTSPTNVNIQSIVGTSQQDMDVFVVEFVPGVLKSIQRGTITFTNTGGTDSENAAITAVGNKAFLNMTGYTSMASGNVPRSIMPGIQLTSPTNINAQIGFISSSPGTTQTVSFEVPEFN